MTLRRVINLSLIILAVNILTSCLRDWGEPQPHWVFLYAPQYMNSPQIRVWQGAGYNNGRIIVRFELAESNKDSRPYDAGGWRTLEYSEYKNWKNEILNALGSNVHSVSSLFYYDATVAGNPVFYADAALYGREPGSDLSDKLFNVSGIVRVTEDYHFDGYFPASSISLKDWLKEGDLICEYADFYFLPSPSESLEGVTLTLEIPVRYAAQWPEYRGSVPYPDNPETTIVCSATMPVSE